MRADTNSSPALSVSGAGSAPAARETMPMGKIGGQEFSRLMMGGNLIGGWSHSRELAYVSTLARRYNTDAKIRETLEVGEARALRSSTPG